MLVRAIYHRNLSPSLCFIWPDKGGYFPKLSKGSKTLVMTSEWLGEMFESEFADMCIEIFLLVWIGGQEEGLAWHYIQIQIKLYILKLESNTQKYEIKAIAELCKAQLKLFWQRKMCWRDKGFFMDSSLAWFFSLI